jgi:hypothetical protein
MQKTKSFALPSFLQPYVKTTLASEPCSSEEEKKVEEELQKEFHPNPNQSQDQGEGPPALKKARLPNETARPVRLSAAVLEDARKMTHNLVMWVLQFEEQPKETRYTLVASQSYLMPLRYTVKKMWLLNKLCDSNYPIRPEFDTIANNTFVHGTVSDLTFIFLALINCSVTCVEYVRCWSMEMSEPHFAYFLRLVEECFLIFNAHATITGGRTTDVSEMAYRSPEEMVVAVVQTMNAYAEPSDR